VKRPIAILVGLLLVLPGALVASAAITDATTGYYGDVISFDIASDGTVTVVFKDVGDPGGSIKVEYAELTVTILADLDGSAATGIAIEAVPKSVLNSKPIVGIDAIINVSVILFLFINEQVIYGNLTIFDSAGTPIVTDLNPYVSSISFDAGTVTISLLWNDIVTYYAETVGLATTPTTGFIYAVADAMDVEFSGAVQNITSSLIWASDMMGPDTAAPVLFTIPAATITIDGSLDDWPAEALALQDDPAPETQYVPHYGDDKIYIAANDTHVFFGVTGTPVSGPVEEVRIDAKAAVLPIMNPDDPTLPLYTFYLDLDNNQLIVFDADGVVVPIDPTQIAFAIGDGVIEIALPAASLPGLTAGSAVNLIPSATYVNYTVQDFLGNREGPPTFHVYQIDYAGPSVTYLGVLDVMSFDAGTASVSLGTASIEFEALGPVSVLYAAFDTPPFAEPPATDLSLISIVYFSFDNPDQVSWPINVTINFGTGYDPATITIYYYDKNEGAYVEAPDTAVIIDEATGQAILQMDRTLYDAGDPAILAYGQPLGVGGTVEDPTSSLAPIIALAAAILLLAALVLARR